MKHSKIIITGGAGFIGSNIAARYMKQGTKVVIFDNLSRAGVEHNLRWLKDQGDFTFIKGDVRNYEELSEAFQAHRDASAIFHEAAQVAVTTSVIDPKEDFEINAHGTIHVLEAFRRYVPAAVFVYASTNKVYGALEEIPVIEKETRYEFADSGFKNGVNERHNIDFHSPYGCSKGAADQYVRDYSRIYNLKTLVFRQSCIYGTRQLGIEDQGWVAWFIIRILFGKHLTLYGTGKQVRDILFVDDLIDGYDMAIDNIQKTRGKIYNMGGGNANALSLLEFIDLLGKMMGTEAKYDFADWRHGDQKIFIADASLAKKDFGWTPKIDYMAGIAKIYAWLKDNQEVLKGIYKDIQ